VTASVSACPGCGTPNDPADGDHEAGPDLVASPTCQRLFEVVLAREFSDPDYFAVHRLTVAAHVLQHPSAHSDRSLAVHLALLRLTTRSGAETGESPAPVRRVPDRLQRLPAPHLEPPTHRGDITVADVVQASTAAEHCRRVRAWSQSVWYAWSPHHATVEAWCTP